ncbi:hypothetical protein [Dysgonomonas reticulitermitis]|nr:hypothetical protein FACS1894169_00680 [Bacteroidia bacterium]
MMKYIIPILLVLILSSCKKDGSIKVEWTDGLKGDFSFTDKWSYDEGISYNEYGQLVCDGLCDDNSYNMLDEDGRIYPDSLHRYYQLVDTAHHYRTIESEAQCYEWAGTDFAYAYRKDDTIKCYTGCNVGTHSSLQIDIIEDICIPQVELNGVSSSGLQYFNGISGKMKIDKTLFDQGILKAEFDFTFEDLANPQEPVWWKGRIQTKISNGK